MGPRNLFLFSFIVGPIELFKYTVYTILENVFSFKKIIVIYVNCV